MARVARAGGGRPPLRRIWWILEGCKIVDLATPPEHPPKGAVAYCFEGDSEWTRLTPEIADSYRTVQA